MERYIREIGSAVAKIKDEPIERVAQVTTENATRLFFPENSK